VCVCEEVAICYQLVATRRPKAVLDVEFDEQFECAVGVTLASMVQEIYASGHVVSCDPAQASHSCVLEVGVVSC
jgi:hypothetical protein